MKSLASELGLSVLVYKSLHNQDFALKILILMGDQYNI